MQKVIYAIQGKILLLLRMLIILSFLCLIAVVLLQIFARFLLPKAPAWTEEIARFCMIYLVSLGAGYAAEANLFMNVDFIEHIVPKVMYQYVVYINKLLCILLMIIFLFYSFAMIKIGIYQYAASIRLPMYYIFFSMFILPVSVLCSYISEIICLCKKQHKRSIPLHE